ncbi:MAG TPA: CDP-diacylglycerol--serine O-phosphatidyltransferase [Candidatus Binataceae bacterium]|nr:CDP-diacylglycerol--serine O-phosphatidyltransferase [Candidatus Binataceae bacterium]
MNNETRRGHARQARMRLISGRIRESRLKVAEPIRRGFFLIPVTITSLGLLSGFYSLVSSVNGHFELAAVMIAVAFICDGLDGRIARASRTASEFGVEYDSLSDVVAFGVAPAALAYCWALKSAGPIGIVATGLYVVCGALRLARFNVQIETTAKNRFVGLPIPGAAIFIAGVALAYSYFEFESPRTLAAFMTPITLVLGGLMISRVPYPSFKSMNPDRRPGVEMLVGIVLVAALLIALPQLTAFVLALAYVSSGPILMFREGMQPRVPVLRPVPKKAEPASATIVVSASPHDESADQES